MNHFGPMIRKLRLARSASLREVADHLGISVPYLSHVERGIRDPFDEPRIRRLADYLPADPGELLEAAWRSQRAIYFETGPLTPAQREVAFEVLRRLPSMSDEEATALRGWLERRMSSR